MIDVNKCVYEETAMSRHGQVTDYFVYPKDMEEAGFGAEEEYGNVVQMCIAMIKNEDGSICLQMSPTIDEDDELCDVEWKDLRPDINYTDDVITGLVQKVKEHDELLGVLYKPIEDDGTETGGVAFYGETVMDFIHTTGEEFYSLNELNAALKECGIKPVHV